MFVLPLDDRAAGRHVGRDIRDARGSVLVRAGTRLTAHTVGSLRQRGFRSFYAENQLAPDLVVEDALRMETRHRATAVVEASLTNLRQGRPLELTAIRQVVDSIMADLSEQSDAAFSVTTLRSIDDYTFVHSVNVCLYSVIMGRCRGYDRHDLRRLGIGALLHDIGKVNYVELVNRAGPLSAAEFEQLKAHTTDGYEMLRHHGGIEILSAHVAYQHHERLDGTGYPRGLTADAVIPYARIAAIADVYDALTGDRAYRGAMPPHEAMTVVQSMAGPKLDAYLCRRFAERVAVYPTGCIVVLSNGAVGVVSGQTLQGPAYPMVRVLSDEHQRLIEPKERQMGDGLAIRAVLDDYPMRVRAQIESRPVVSTP